MTQRGVIRKLVVLLVTLAAAAAHAAEFTFDAAEFGKRPFQWSGYAEYRYDYFGLNPGGAFYGLAFRNRGEPSRLDRNAAALKLEGQYTAGTASIRTRTHLEYSRDQLDHERTARFDELAASWKPNPGITVEAGKIALKWGKGYAWNPVAFVERLKDPNDPELSREGFWMATADWVRTFNGPLKTIAFTPVVLPVGGDVNSEFGATRHTNVAGKLYVLWYDTDIDFVYLSGGSRTRRVGFDFSRNITSNLEMHGEWARISDFERRVLSSTGTVRAAGGNVNSYLLGVRYLTARDATYILEYYHNGTGFTRSEMEDFFRFVQTGPVQAPGAGTEAPFGATVSTAQVAYGRPQTMQRYAYLRVSQKDPFDILYFTPAFTTIVNLADRSFSATPELLYTGFTNVELRMRFFYLQGRELTDFGEKANKRRLELRARLYF